MNPGNDLPPRWDEARIRRVLEHYENQTDEEAVAEDEQYRSLMAPRGPIDAKPDVLGGQPFIAGTRITVEEILEDLGSGETIDEIVQTHPGLSRNDVLAAVRYGAQAVRETAY